MFAKNSMGRRHLRGPGVHGRIILKRMFEKIGVKVVTSYN
jgi:hypothetical protein